MDIVYKIELKWHLGYPDSDESFTEIVSLFDKEDKDISQNFIVESLANARLFEEYDFVEIYEGIRSSHQVALKEKNNNRHSSKIYIDVYLLPMLEKNGMYFELNQVYV